MSDGTTSDSTPSHADLADRAEVAARLAIAVGRLNRRIRSISELTPGQVSALSTIVVGGPIRPGDLARVERVAAPTITRLLVDLEARGLVTRSADPADGRSFFVTATDAGGEAIDRARTERAERVLAIFDVLDEEQIEKLAGALDALEAATEANPAG